MLYYSLRAALFSGLISLAAATAFAQSTRTSPSTRGVTTTTGQNGAVQYNPGVRPAIITPARPAVVTPARPAIVTPARPAVTYPASPSVTYPINPKVTYPAAPPVNPPTVTPVKPSANYPYYPNSGYPNYPDPGYPGYPGVIITQPPQVYIVPQYPSAYIGPEIIRITTGPSESTLPSQSPLPPAVPAPSQPATLTGEDAQTRLVAILGKLQRVGPAATTTGASGGGDQLNIGLGTLAEYQRALPGTTSHHRAIGNYFGYCWDGDQWETSSTGAWTRGPQTRQPILALNELQPVRWPFDVGAPGHRIVSLRLAIALLAYEGVSRRPFPAADRYGDMSTSLKRDSWTPSGVDSQTEPTDSLPENYAGTPSAEFGAALSQATSRVMGPPTASHTLGVTEWSLSLNDLRQVMARCPRFATAPQTAELQAARAKDPAEKPHWVRPFRMEVATSPDGPSGSQPTTIYQGEIWFVILPNAGIRTWQTGSTTTLGAPLAP